MRLRGTNRNFRRVSPRVPFNPRKLFRNSEQGVHYDPSDFSTLFQDSVGTTPVTAVEQPVGLMLDKRLGLVLGSELIVNGDGTTTAGWNASGATLSSSNGKLVVTANTTGVAARANQAVATVAGRAYQVTFRARKPSGVGVSVGSFASGTSAGSGYGNSATETDRRYVFFAVGSSTLVNFEMPASGITAGDLAEFDNISVRELPGNHAYQTTAIDRPILRQDAGGRYYLAANGTNTGMQTNSIDFSSTDKVTVFAGVRKLSDATTGVMCELGASSAANNGTFHFALPNVSGAGDYGFYSRGTSRQSAGTAALFQSPISSVLTGVGDISGDIARLRVNGTQAAISTSDQGTGNYGNYPLYLFRRGGTTLPFNGNFYGLLIRGALTSDPDTLKMERWLALKTGVQL